MERRSFLKILGLGAAAAALPKPEATGTTVVDPPVLPPMSLAPYAYPFSTLPFDPVCASTSDCSRLVWANMSGNSVQDIG